MFELTSTKLDLITPLLTVAGAVDKKQSTPILSDILMQLKDNQLYLTATDLEIEMTARIPCISEQKAGIITVPAKKIVDIMRSLDDDASPTMICRDGILAIRAGRSQFKLATLAADEYPKMQEEVSELIFYSSLGIIKFATVYSFCIDSE